MLLRTAAEFDNYKKRVAREKQESAKLANEGILQKLIPVLDNFEMALAATGNSGGRDSPCSTTPSCRLPIKSDDTGGYSQRRPPTSACQ